MSELQLSLPGRRGPVRSSSLTSSTRRLVGRGRDSRLPSSPPSLPAALRAIVAPARNLFVEAQRIAARAASASTRRQMRCLARNPSRGSDHKSAKSNAKR